jgi:hypothetical protein
VRATYIEWVHIGGCLCHVCYCHHSLARPPAADGGDGLQIRIVAADRLILNTQSLTADKESLSVLGVGRSVNSTSLYYEIHKKNSELDELFGANFEAFTTVII